MKRALILFLCLSFLYPSMGATVLQGEERGDTPPKTTRQSPSSGEDDEPYEYRNFLRPLVQLLPKPNNTLRLGFVIGFLSQITQYKAFKSRPALLITLFMVAMLGALSCDSEEDQPPIKGFKRWETLFHQKVKGYLQYQAPAVLLVGVVIGLLGKEA